MAAREFARDPSKWLFTEAQLIAKGWLTGNDHLRWKDDAGVPGSAFAFIKQEIHALFDMMEDDRDRYLAEINAQADGLAGYLISFLGIDSERQPWTVELIRCGLAIGNIVYMSYKQVFRRVRPSTICPGLVPPFGPPRHPAFPSGHSFLGHFIALLLLEIPQLEARFGEPTNAGPPPVGPLVKPTLAQVMSAGGVLYVFKGPLLWLGARLGKNRERAGLHYPSDSLASRWLAGATWKLLTARPIALELQAAKPPAANNPVAAGDLIDCPTLRRVLRLAKAEWA
jgi:membrane-associated phospholipid phosphatase